VPAGRLPGEHTKGKEKKQRGKSRPNAQLQRKHTELYKRYIFEREKKKKKNSFVALVSAGESWEEKKESNLGPNLVYCDRELVGGYKGGGNGNLSVVPSHRGGQKAKKIGDRWPNKEARGETRPFVLGWGKEGDACNRLGGPCQGERKTKRTKGVKAM